MSTINSFTISIRMNQQDTIAEYLFTPLAKQQIGFEHESIVMYQITDCNGDIIGWADKNIFGEVIQWLIEDGYNGENTSMSQSIHVALRDYLGNKGYLSPKVEL